MSDQQPPPPPWGNDPSAPYGQQPPSGPSNKGRFWIGVALAIPVLIGAGILNALAGGIGSGLDDSGTAAGLLLLLVNGLLLAALITGIVLPRTRFLTLGVLAGSAVVFVLAAGACVALIAGLENSYG